MFSRDRGEQLSAHSIVPRNVLVNVSELSDTKKIKFLHQSTQLGVQVSFELEHNSLCTSEIASRAQLRA